MSTILVNNTPYSAKLEGNELTDFFAALATVYSLGGNTPLTGVKVDRYASARSHSVPFGLKAFNLSPNGFLRPLGEPTRAMLYPVSFSYLDNGGSCSITGIIAKEITLPDADFAPQLAKQVWDDESETLTKEESIDDNRLLPVGSRLTLTLNWAQNIGTLTSYQVANPDDPSALGTETFCNDTLLQMYSLPYNDVIPKLPVFSKTDKGTA